MLIKYHLDIGDIIAFNHFRNSQSKTYCRMRIISIFILPTIIFASSFLYKDTSGTITAAIFALILALLMWKGIPRHIDKNIKQMYKEGKNKALLGERQLEIDENHILTRSQYSETELKWDTVEKICFTNDYTFIFVSSFEAIGIPSRAITEGNYEVFKEQLKEIFDKKKSEGLNSDEEPNPKIIDLDKHFKPIDKRFGKHSELGIISFIVSLVVWVSFLTAILIIILGNSTSKATPKWYQQAVDFLFEIIFPITFLGIVFGILGLLQKNRKKLLAVIGLILDAVMICIWVIIMLIQNLVGPI